MSDNDVPFWAIVVFCAMFFIAGLVVGYDVTCDMYRKQAIEHGVAEWRVDAKTGDTEFVWLGDKDE